MRFEQDALAVPALRVLQGDFHVYTFFLPGHLLLRVARVSHLRRGPDGVEGFQRRPVRRHIQGIVEYLARGEVLFPNAIVLALPYEVEFREARVARSRGVLNVSDSGVLRIPLTDDEPPGWVVDGQQRCLALEKSENGHLPVPVVAFVASEVDVQREQFILVNKARPLPARLLNALLPEVDGDLPRDLDERRIPGMLCDRLQRDPNSPFHGLIRRASESDRAGEWVVDSAIMEVIRRSLGNPLGALAQFAGMGSEQADIHGMYQTLATYWQAVRDTFPDAWDRPPAQSRLMHAAGIKAMGSVMDRIMTRAHASPAPERVVHESLERLAPYCRWTAGTWEGLGLAWDEVQDVPGHVKALAAELVRLDYDLSQPR
jgi:DGQHR domain-containing protein